jgi:hypothetical protein
MLLYKLLFCNLSPNKLNANMALSNNGFHLFFMHKILVRFQYSNCPYADIGENPV